VRDRWLIAWGIGSVAFGGASLLVPLYLVALGAGPVALGVLAATAAIAGAPGAIVVGRLADRSGRRRVFVVGGLLAVAAALAAMPLTTSVPALIALNGVVWFAIAALGPVVTLLVTADVSEASWASAIARLNRAQGWGWAAGLVLGAVWTALVAAVVGPLAAQRGFFIATAVLAAVGGVTAGRWLPAEAAPASSGVDGAVASVNEVARTNGGRRFPSGLYSGRWVPLRAATFPALPGRWLWLTRLRRNGAGFDRFSRSLWTYYLAAVCFFAGFGAFFAPLPLYLSDVGFGDGAIFAFYVVSSLGSAACYRGAGSLAERFDLAGLQAAGLLGRGLALPAVALVGGLWAASALGAGLTAVTFAVIGVTWAVIAVTAATYVTQLAPTASRGEALGLYVALSSIAAGVGSLLGGVLASVGYLVAFAVAGALVVAGAAIVLLAARRSAAESPLGSE